ncbi:hypothetical protein DH2020_041180 [Rehmannia glutinosa]|uniref:CASP-like protein n=1 Tax=Rehmannia glutinosa TaxID=99300 RepID=A0ABR0UQY0_REHGL
MTNGPKTGPEVSIQLPETKMATESGPLSGPLVSSQRPDSRTTAGHRKSDVMHVVVRMLCLLTSVTALYLVGVSAAVALHSLLQLLIIVSRMLRKSPVIASRKHAWLIFAGDQIFAYAMMSAGSAASGVTNLNRTGIQHSALPNFCKPLHVFCDCVAVSIAFTFFSCFLLAISVVLDVVWLSKY